MFVIRQEQMDALSRQLLRSFVVRMLLQLKTAFPERTKGLTDDELRERIEAGIERAAKYGVTDEADVERYLEYVVRYGPDFDTNKKTFWAGQILREQSLSGTKKMNRIDDYDLFAMRGSQP
jgi:hypothetical protein